MPAVLLSLALAACSAPAPRAQDPALAAAASVAEVRSGTAPTCAANGAAVHLGGGRFVTAAHVVDGSAQRLRGGCPSLSPAVAILVRGTPAPAAVLRVGRDRVDPGIGQRYLGAEDLALLRPVGTLPQLGTASPCAGEPAAGAPALLVTPRRLLRTRILGPWQDPDSAFGTYVEIPVALEAGESGGALFDAASGCLAGLVSHRDEDGGPPRTRLVPAPLIRRFAAP